MKEGEKSKGNIYRTIMETRFSKQNKIKSKAFDTRGAEHKQARNI